MNNSYIRGGCYGPEKFDRIAHAFHALIIYGQSSAAASVLAAGATKEHASELALPK